MSEMYKKSGVNLDEAEKLNAKLKSTLKTKNLGAFAGAVEIADPGLKLLTCCDGIGSKIIPLYEKKMFREIAVDLIAANLNDMATRPARAVSFADYIAVNRLDSSAISAIITELENELQKYDCELIGGETSEMPHLLRDGVIDICGFAIGIEKDIKLLPVQSGDIVIGLKSSGIHANGFTLIRKLFTDGKLSDVEFEETLVPAYIYYNEIQSLWDNNLIKAAANITGGGIFDNLIRVIPEGLTLELNYNNIPAQGIFEKLKKITGDEMYKVFNCGAGFCVVAASDNLAGIEEICRNYEPFILGRVKEA